jgi:hypothetical protein
VKNTAEKHLVELLIKGLNQGKRATMYVLQPINAFCANGFRCIYTIGHFALISKLVWIQFLANLQKASAPLYHDRFSGFVHSAGNLGIPT